MGLVAIKLAALIRVVSMHRTVSTMAVESS